jgi:hypothetical protein
MPISLARKLQALRVLKFPDLWIEVHHVALTLDQVIAFDLPSTPLKDTEKRGDHWRSVMGREQTEIDALAALRPQVLRRIAREAIAPFWDASLDRRAVDARTRWQEAAEETLRDDPAYEPACKEISAARDRVKEAADELRDCQARAVANLTLELPEAELVEAELEGDQPAPLFDSRVDYVAASRRLIDHKKLNGHEQ